jgi:hypothetical protein
MRRFEVTFIAHAEPYAHSYMGAITPVFGRWVWPFRKMKPGDYFVVSHEHRTPEDLRNMVSVRAAQLGKRFSVNKDFRPGLTSVTCIPLNAPGRGRKAPGALDYGAVTEMLGRCYGVDAGKLKWTAMDVGEVERIEAKQLEAPLQPVYMAVIPDDWKFALELGPGSVEVTRVEQNETVESFTKAKLDAIFA